MSLTIRPATEIEMPRVKAFVEMVGMPFVEQEEADIQYLTAKDHEAELAAIVGIIGEQDTMILRHLIADPKRCDLGMLLEILENAVAFCASNKAKKIVFQTLAPAELFESIGFERTLRSDLDPAILAILPPKGALQANAEILVRDL